MAEKTKYQSGEYLHLCIPGSSITERDRLTLSTISDRLLSCREGVKGLELQFGALCGVIELDTCAIEVHPKLVRDGNEVVRWINYAYSVPTQTNPVRSWSTNVHGLRDVIIAALINECEALLRQGLRLDYRRLQVVDTTLRGRLDIARQISRCYEQVDQLHLRRFDRVIDIWENVSCRTALGVASTVAGSTEMRKRAAEIERAFCCPAERPDVVAKWLTLARYHRMNATGPRIFGPQSFLVAAGYLTCCFPGPNARPAF